MTQLNTVIPANEARANFYQILDEVSDKLRQFTITLRGRQKAIIMSADEYEGWLATLDIISDRNLFKDLKKSLKSKKTYSWNQASKKIGW